MEKIKLAEDSIKHLKDFIEIEKVSKKITTETAKHETQNLSRILMNIVELNVKDIKGE